MNILYLIFIYPIELLIELVFQLFYWRWENCGISLAAVSLAVSFLSLPLYIIAERWQQKERDIQKAFKPEVDEIKAVFKGDERYMILSTFYRQNHYHPVMALRSSISLMIQVPFFIAAYVYLSNLVHKGSWIPGPAFLHKRLPCEHPPYSHDCDQHHSQRCLCKRFCIQGEASALRHGSPFPGAALQFPCRSCLLLDIEQCLLPVQEYML